MSGRCINKSILLEKAFQSCSFGRKKNLKNFTLFSKTNMSCYSAYSCGNSGSSLSQMFYTITVLKIFGKFTGKEAPEQLFFCEFLRNFKNNFFSEHLRAIASVTLVKITLKKNFYSSKKWMH